MLSDHKKQGFETLPERKNPDSQMESGIIDDEEEGYVIVDHIPNGPEDVLNSEVKS
jgi:hypothetical protein